jgi:cobaltochelatase CobN
LRQAPHVAAPDAARGVAPDEAAVAQAQTQVAPTAAAPKVESKPTPPAKNNNEPQQVAGFEMQSISTLTPAQKTIGTLALLVLAALLMGIGYWRKSAR